MKKYRIKEYVSLFDLLGEKKYRTLNRLVQVFVTDPSNRGVAYADRQADKLHTPTFADHNELARWVANNYDAVFASIQNTPELR